MQSIEEVLLYAMGVIRGKNAIFPLIASADGFARSIQSRLYRSHLQVRAVYTVSKSICGSSVKVLLHWLASQFLLDELVSLH